VSECVGFDVPLDAFSHFGDDDWCNSCSESCCNDYTVYSHYYGESRYVTPTKYSNEVFSVKDCKQTENTATTPRVGLVLFTVCFIKNNPFDL